ncbi:hypothetical protein FHS82_000335 [Pseudochelatococcus lubricantis]|uniref:DUF2497 domain-containing protein n=2 Tax=Pseudochelatococcus lubricantis TaxID=1538102 RepID=A0ABX0UU83_9HYPH|nr:DUF2497 domain-containing protein [Pseudochelatococcus lubricantis]NIJ56522.1 hypothetical protein [Pseudochelatococcus lubricantis]
MEEILASIRRIIADDQAHSLPPLQPDSLGLDSSSITFDDDVSPETEELEQVVAPQPAPAARTDKPARASGNEARAAETVSPPPAAPPASPPQTAAAPASRQAEERLASADDAARPAQDDEPLLSTSANATAASAFESLSSVVLSRNPRTLDDLVQDMLRPLLKTWLDENLPPLVEKLVRAEIERITRGTRR